MKKRWQNGLALLPLLLLAIPLLLQPAAEDRLTRDGAETLVVLPPHSESIRYEFERAFQKYYREHYGRDIVIDWRSPGGSSDIVRYIDDRYEAAFREYFLSDPANGGWDEEIAVNYANHRLNPATASPRAVKARELFLNSDVGIGVDLFFGGGMYDQQKHAARGFAVDGGVARRHPDIFRPEVIPASFSGETLFDLQGRTYGVCLSSFGICYNPDRLAELGGTPPHSWSDLGEGKFFRTLSVADPTKSGSITKCFEMILQQNMQQAQKSDPEHGVADGWANGMNLIKRIAGNAVTITDSAGKVTRDVASGNAAVDRLLVDDVLHNGVRQAVHKANVVGAAQLLGLRLTRVQRPNGRIDREMLCLRLYSGQTVPNLFPGHLLVAADLFDALLVQSQLERGGSTLVLLHEAHPEERRVPARKRGRRLKPTGQIVQHFL